MVRRGCCSNDYGNPGITRTISGVAESADDAQATGDWTEITTPFLDRHNDRILIYVKRGNVGYVLTDDSYTIHDLEQSGCVLETKKRLDLLQMTLNGFGVQLNEQALEVKATSENFASRKHSLIQAMLAVNDLFYLATPVVSSLFLEDVTTWFDLDDLRYTPRVKFSGKTGYDHLFDFVIPKSRHCPERILKAINTPEKESAESLIFAWMDTREVRPPDSQAYAILNDSDRNVSDSVRDAFRNWEITPVLWSERDAIRGALAA